MQPPAFPAAVEAAARAHAVATWPEEACGIVAEGAYLALVNEAADRCNAFRLPARTFADHAVEAVIHSHCAPEHGPWPSAADMRGQIDTAVPWGIVRSNGSEAVGPLWFGDFVLDQPILGRPFQPGIRDCYALLRAWFRQERGVTLREFPRDDQWWTSGGDLLREGFSPAGFRPIRSAEAGEGDVVLGSIHAQGIVNHCGIVLAGGLVLHHLANRLSRREPLGPWRRYITHWLRYEGNGG